MKNNNTVYNPYAQNLTGIIEGAIRKYLQKFQTCIPAVVTKVIDRKHVIVSPAVEQINRDWKSVQWANIKLPVCTPYGSDIFVSFKLSAGDTGWIIAGDLDPTLFFNNPSKPQRQNTLERHKYQFGFFVPDSVNGFNIDSNENGLVVGSADGKTRVIIGKESLKIKADSVIIETTDGTSVTIDGIDWKNHKHVVTENGVPTLKTTATIGDSATPGTISGKTGKVDTGV